MRAAVGLQRRRAWSGASTALRRQVLDPELWLWGLPVLAGAAAYLAPQRLEQGTAALVAVAAVVLVVARPAAAAMVLVAALPFQILLFAGLYRLGLPGGIVRSAGYWKEAVVVGLALAAVRRAVQIGRRPDALDWAGFLYVASVSLYLVLPALFVNPAAGDPQPPTDLLVRVLAFRADTFLVVLLLAARHLGFDRAAVSRLAGVALASGAVVAALGVFERVAGGLWGDLLVDVLEVHRFQLDLFDELNPRIRDILVTGQVGRPDGAFRSASVFLSPLPLGFFLLVPLAIGLERIGRGAARRWEVVATVVSAGCIVLTQTRSALLGAVVVVLLSLRPAPGRSPSTRARMALALAALLVLVSPLAATAGLTDRAGAAIDGDESTTAHLTGLSTGVEVLVDRPLGRGLGTAAGIGQRFEVQGTVVPENYYLQVGNEVGAHTMLAFLALGGLALVALRRRAQVDGSPSAAALRGAGFGLAVGGMFLHVFSNLQAAWPAWLLAGAAIGVLTGDAPEAPDAPGTITRRPGTG